MGETQRFDLVTVHYGNLDDRFPLTIRGNDNRGGLSDYLGDERIDSERASLSAYNRQGR
jgi:hypothetical protein